MKPFKPAKVLSYIVNHVLTLHEWRAISEACREGNVGDRNLRAIREVANKHGAHVPVVLAACGFLRDAETGKFVDTVDTVDLTRTAVLPADSRVHCAYALWRFVENGGCQLLVE